MRHYFHAATLLGILSCVASPIAAQTTLAGTSWQLVRFQGGDDTVLTPPDRSAYTLTFDATGNGVAVRIDCNRGRGTWTSAGDGRIEFGALALTRALCPAGSLHDQIVKQFGSIRSYVLRDGRLFLSLMADGGMYEFEPLGSSSPAFRTPVAVRGPLTWTCTSGAATAGTGEPLRFTHYATDPALILLEYRGTTKAAFQVRSASGARYEGDDVQFWEARGEASLDWNGTRTTCRPS